MQKIAANFISGIILLFEKSLEEGDSIILADSTEGIVKTITARYTLIEDFDGSEVLVPNEQIITNKVTSLTLSHNHSRVKMFVGIAYDSDLDLAKKTILDIMKKHPRCSIARSPSCYVKEFADSSINIMVNFWVDDVQEGRLCVRDEILSEIWRQFKKLKIEIPFPQRDVFVKNKSVK